MILTNEFRDQVINLVKINESRLKNGYSVNTGSTHLADEYLGKNPDRKLFGVVADGRLVSMISLRVGYPVPGTAIVGNFFADVSVTDVKLKIKAVAELYAFAKANNILTLYSSVRAERFRTQASIPMRLYDEIAEYNCLGVCEYVPAGATPSEPWMYVIMGSRPAPTDTVIRQITYDGGASWRAFTTR